MDFELSEEQSAFRDAVRQFCTASSTRERIRSVVDGAAPYDMATWRSMAAQLGLQGIAIREESGGSGASFVELAVVLEETGRAIACTPLFATSVLAALSLEFLAGQRACERWLPPIASGEIVATLAIAEPGGTFDAGSFVVTARPTDWNWVLNGVKTHVIDGASADLLLVLASTADGPHLFAVETGAPGLTCTEQVVMDPTRPMAAVTMVGVPCELAGDASRWDTGYPRLLAAARIALAAEQLGGAQACLDMSVAHASSRVQFGRTLGSFQAIKHKCATLFVDLEAARSAVYFAAWSAASLELGELSVLADMTSAFVSDVFFRAASEAIQILGGIGYTWEHDIHLLFKRATASRQLLGAPKDRYDAIASAIGL